MTDIPIFPFISLPLRFKTNTMRINTRHLFNGGMLSLIVGLLLACAEQPEKATADQTISPELKALNLKIAGEPQNAQNFVDRSRWYSDHNQPDSALRDVRRALAIDSLNPAHYIALSEVYQFTGKFQDAEKALIKARALNPDDNEARIAHARFYLVFKNYEEAIKLVEEAIKKTPRNPKAYFIAGLVFLEKGDTTAAIRNLMQATAQDNRYFDAWLRLALIYSKKQDQLAEGYFKTALRLRSDSKAAWYLMGFFYQESGAYQKAIAAYDSVLKIDPGFRDAIYNKGYVAMVVDEDYDKAIGLFEQALRVSPNWTNALYNLGYARELQGDIEKARNDYQAVIAIDPGHEMARKALDRTKR